MWWLLCTHGVAPAARVDVADVEVAMQTVTEEMPWARAFALARYCLLDDAPYTMRIDLRARRNATERRSVTCARPWRSASWMCEEEEAGSRASAPLVSVDSEGAPCADSRTGA